MPLGNSQPCLVTSFCTGLQQGEEERSEALHPPFWGVGSIKPGGGGRHMGWGDRGMEGQVLTLTLQLPGWSRTAASASPRDLLEMQDLRSYPKLAKLESPF